MFYCFFAELGSGLVGLFSINCLSGSWYKYISVQAKDPKIPVGIKGIAVLYGKNLCVPAPILVQEMPPLFSGVNGLGQMLAQVSVLGCGNNYLAF